MNNDNGRTLTLTLGLLLVAALGHAAEDGAPAAGAPRPYSAPPVAAGKPVPPAPTGPEKRFRYAKFVCIGSKIGVPLGGPESCKSGPEWKQIAGAKCGKAGIQSLTFDQPCP
jgi:hypothetical protein